MPPQKSITKAIAEVVSVLAFYSDDPSLKPTVFSVTFVIERNENNQKEAGLAIWKSNEWYFIESVPSHADNREKILFR